MHDLPEEVWRIVVEYLPPSTVTTLISVNRAFYNIVLDERYRKVEWVRMDNNLKRSLERLRYLDIAKRVRHLHLRGWFIQSSFMGEDRAQRQIKGTLARQSFLNLMSFRRPKRPSYRLFHQPIAKPQPTIESISSDSQLPATSQAVLKAMMAILANLTSVTELNLEWRNLPIDTLTQNLLTASWHSFGNNLSTLTISARVSKFKDILPATPLPALEELQLVLEYDPLDTDDAFPTALTNETIFAESIAPFINRLNTSLSHLTLSSTAKGDHSVLFRHIRQLNHLKHLALCIYFDSKHLSSTKPIYDFLNAHQSSITDVELRTNCPAPGKGTRSDLLYQREDLELPSWDTLCKYSINDGAWLKHLDSLTIPSYNQAATLDLISHTPQTVSKLCLLDRYLPIGHTKEIIGLLSSYTGLRTLSLEIVELTPRLTSLLANSLPLLKSLTLVLGTNRTDAYVLRHWAAAGYKCHDDWPLFDLSIYFRKQRPDSIVIPETFTEHEVMRGLQSDVFPRVQNFRGHGNLHLKSVEAPFVFFGFMGLGE